MNPASAITGISELEIISTQQDFKISLDLLDASNDILNYKFSLKADAPASPEPITVKWKLPAINLKGVWKPGSLHNKRIQYDWELDHLQSRISVDAPVVSVFDNEDQNIITFACSDAINLVVQNVLLREEDNHLYCHLSFFKERFPEIKEYETFIRIDLRSIAFGASIQAVSQWWEQFEHLQPAPTPPIAQLPLYSTWYQFHQNLEFDVLVRECEQAKALGYELIILDDGWQTLDDNRGYDYTGDWRPERLPNMGALVHAIHEIGMKVGLWFSVPFCGRKSQAYQLFKGKFLTERHRWAPIFDPRFPEVRAYLIDIYKNALTQWN